MNWWRASTTRKWVAVLAVLTLAGGWAFSQRQDVDRRVVECLTVKEYREARLLELRAQAKEATEALRSQGNTSHPGYVTAYANNSEDPYEGDIKAQRCEEVQVYVEPLYRVVRAPTDEEMAAAERDFWAGMQAENSSEPS